MLGRVFQRMMSTEMKRSSLIGVAQLTCTHDKKENLAKCKDMVIRAKQQGCQMIFFPECTDYIGRNKKEAIDISENKEGSIIKAFCELAKCHQIWISIGGFHNKKDEEKMPYNTHLILNSDGIIVQEYDKLHQFNLDIPGTRLLEKEFSTEGNAIIQPFSTPVGNIGMGICYDVRFPELATYYRRSGAHILTYPAAFTVPTGSVHWEVLLRCRAIENQCYVVCAAQFGNHNPNRASYGHAMVVDPNGAVIAQCSDKEDLIVAKIDLDYLDLIRSRLNVLGDRRKDLYTVHFKENLVIKAPAKFADHTIPQDQIFYETQKTVAFVNIKPVTNGHVLVVPKRMTKYFQELALDEVCDLMSTVQTIEKAVLEYHKLTDCTISIQDGPLSGQTVPHVHVHIVPRRPNDFSNDDIYKELEDKTKTQPLRELGDMASEAAAYRKILRQ